MSGQAPRSAMPDRNDPGEKSRPVPNLCAPGALLVHLLVATLVALLLAAGRLDSPVDFWPIFGLTLLFVVWVTFLSLALLCQLQRSRWLDSRAGLSLSIILVFTLISLLTSLAVVVYLPLSDSHWFVLRNTLLAGVLSLVLVRFLVLQADWKRQVAAESAARLDALQARIQPHFLFNALNTITELVHSRPEQAEEALLDLSDLLRTGLRTEARHTLQEEFELVRGYLRIEKLRLGERLGVDWSMDESVDLTTRVPALLVQPLIENAVLHGIAPRPEGGLLSIRLESARFSRARIIVENPLPSPDQPQRQGNRTALENIRQRLALAYEEGASLKTEKTDSMFRAVLTLPLKSDSTD